VTVSPVTLPPTAPPPVAAASVPAPPASCKAFEQWPGLEGNTDCGQCRHLVVVSDFKSCGEYCQSFEHQCFFAGASVREPGGQLDCQALFNMDCDSDVKGDMVCGCTLPGAPPPALGQSLPTPAPPAPQEVACLPVAHWPDRDGEVSCGACKELVATSAFKSCGPYCASFGQECFYAAADAIGPDSIHGEACQVLQEVACQDDLSALTANTNDMICGCRNPAVVGEAPSPELNTE
jgi:hypothetical protein